MYINTSILYHHLSSKYDIVMHCSQKNTSLCSFKIYEGDVVSVNHLYVIRADQLAFLDVEDEDVTFLCTGAEELPELNLVQDIILIKDFVNLPTLLNTLGDIFDLYNRWEEKLNLCSCNLQGISNMLNESRTILRGSIILADYHFNYLAYTYDFENTIRKIHKTYRGQTPSYIIDELLTDPAYFKVQNSREIFSYPIHDGYGTEPALCYNLFRGSDSDYRARILFVTYEEEFTEDQRYLLVFLANKINTIYNQISDYSLPFPAYDGLRDAITNCIRQKVSSFTMISATLRYIRWNDSDQYILCKFEPSFLDSSKEMNAISRNELELLCPSSCAVLYDSSIVLLINLTQNDMLNNKIDSVLHDDISSFIRERLYKIGISNPFNGFANIYSAYKEATAALDLGNSKDNMFWYYHFSDYALDYMLNKCTEDIPAKELCVQGLLKLIESDQKNNTDYVYTLKTFIDAKYNVTHAAQVLFIHRTTLLKHLKKIGSITGLSLDDWNTRLHLLLSYQLLNK